MSLKSGKFDFREGIYYYVKVVKKEVSLKLLKRFMVVALSFVFILGQVETVSAKENEILIGDGIYHIVNVDKNQMLNIDMNLVNSTNAITTKWKVTNENGDIIIESYSNGQILSSKKNEVNMRDNQNKKSQKWKLKQVENGYQIVSLKNKKDYLVNEENTQLKKDKSQSWVFQQASTWTGAVLSSSAGSIQGPSGKETYYNLDMSRVVANMQAAGYSGSYWIREDGAKMFGDYVMVAAELSSRPKGTILETSLGLGIVCDTGGFAASNPTQIDIATNW